MGRAATRDVVCYHCRGRIEVPQAARTVTCPCCFKGLLLDDLVVSTSGWPGKLETCGVVRIDKRARTVTRFVLAGDGVEVQGVLEARVSTSGGVLVRRGGHVKGDIEATSITVEPGATMEGVSLCIRPLPSASPQ